MIDPFDQLDNEVNEVGPVVFGTDSEAPRYLLQAAKF